MENVQMKKIIQELRHILSHYEKETAKLKQQYTIDISNKEQVIQSLTSLIGETTNDNIQLRAVDFMN